MSMPVTFYALTSDQLAAYELARAPVEASGVDPQDVLEEATSSDPKSYAFMDWESFGLSYLLGERSEGGRFEPVFGPNDHASSEDVVLPSVRVKEVAALLAGVSHETLRGRWDPEEMARLGVYPENAWSEPDALASLLGAFDDVRALYAHAASEGLAVVIDGGV